MTNNDSQSHTTENRIGIILFIIGVSIGSLLSFHHVDSTLGACLLEGGTAVDVYYGHPPQECVETFSK